MQSGYAMVCRTHLVDRLELPYKGLKNRDINLQVYVLGNGTKHASGGAERSDAVSLEAVSGGNADSRFKSIELI